MTRYDRSCGQKLHVGIGQKEALCTYCGCNVVIGMQNAGCDNKSLTKRQKLYPPDQLLQPACSYGGKYSSAFILLLRVRLNPAGQQAPCTKRVLPTSPSQAPSTHTTLGCLHLRMCDMVPENCCICSSGMSKSAMYLTATGVDASRTALFTCTWPQAWQHHCIPVKTEADHWSCKDMQMTLRCASRLASR